MGAGGLLTSDGPVATNGTTTDRARRVAKRTPLPTGRAVVGGLLVAASALGVFAAYSAATAGPETRYVVARHEIPAGTRLTRADLAFVVMDAPDVLAGKAIFRDPDQLVGTTVVDGVGEAELIQASDVVRKESGTDELEVSFAIESSRALGGNLAAGELVDVLSTFGAGGDSYTAVVVDRAKVLGRATKKGTLADGRTETITLAVRNREEALRLAHAVNVGDLTLVRATGAPAAGGPDTFRAPASEE